jgi:hypothetical protein
VLGLVDVRGTVRLQRMSPTEGRLSLVTFGGRRPRRAAGPRGGHRPVVGRVRGPGLAAAHGRAGADRGPQGIPRTPWGGGSPAWSSCGSTLRCSSPTPSSSLTSSGGPWRRPTRPRPVGRGRHRAGHRRRHSSLRCPGERESPALR